MIFVTFEQASSFLFLLSLYAELSQLAACRLYLIFTVWMREWFRSPQSNPCKESA